MDIRDITNDYSNMKIGDVVLQFYQNAKYPIILHKLERFNSLHQPMFLMFYPHRESIEDYSQFKGSPPFLILSTNDDQ